MHLFYSILSLKWLLRKDIRNVKEKCNNVVFQHSILKGMLKSALFDNFTAQFSHFKDFLIVVGDIILYLYVVKEKGRKLEQHK